MSLRRENYFAFEQGLLASMHVLTQSAPTFPSIGVVPDDYQVAVI